MIYLASPYSHPDPAVRERRYHAACQACAKLLREGHVVFSPIVHHHPLAESYGLPGGWDFWRRIDVEFIRRCEQVMVLKIDGWNTSEGVRSELEIAETIGIRVQYMEP